MYWFKKNSFVRSVKLSIIFRSSGGHPFPEIPWGQIACGRFVSPQRNISGVGASRRDSDLLRAASAQLNCVEVDRCPPVMSSGCRYITTISMFGFLSLTPSISITPDEKFKNTSAPTARSSRKYSATPPLSLPRLLFLRRFRSWRYNSYPSMSISSFFWSLSQVSVSATNKSFCTAR